MFRITIKTDNLHVWITWKQETLRFQFLDFPPIWRGEGFLLKFDGNLFKSCRWPGFLINHGRIEIHGPGIKEEEDERIIDRICSPKPWFYRVSELLRHAAEKSHEADRLLK